MLQISQFGGVVETPSFPFAYGSRVNALFHELLAVTHIQPTSLETCIRTDIRASVYNVLFRRCLDQLKNI
jgi:hypothetical protein